MVPGSLRNGRIALEVFTDSRVGRGGLSRVCKPMGKERVSPDPIVAYLMRNMLHLWNGGCLPIFARWPHDIFLNSEQLRN